MRVFGLTGGIASGKGVVARRFQERGVPVVDADALAREVVVPGSHGFTDVVLEFGPDILSPSQEIDRKVLGRLVFSDPALLRRLEAILHPLIHEALEARVRQLEADGHLLACYEAPVLIEAGRADQFRPLVVVSATVPVQVERILRRDGLSPDEARARVASQLPLAEKLRFADYIVENSSSFQSVIGQADAVLDSVCDELGVPLSRYPIP